MQLSSEMIWFGEEQSYYRSCRKTSEMDWLYFKEVRQKHHKADTRLESLGKKVKNQSINGTGRRVREDVVIRSGRIWTGLRKLARDRENGKDLLVVCTLSRDEKGYDDDESFHEQ